MKLTQENYYTETEYFSVSLYKSMMRCEAAAMAQLRGEYKPPVTRAMLVGSFVDAWAEGTLDRFIKENPAIFNRKKELRADFRRANEIIQIVQTDEKFMQFMSGEKQKILTFQLFGAPWKAKLDSFVENICITDLKVVAKYENLWKFRYDIQGAIYQKGAELCGYRKLPFYLAVCTKDRIANHDIFQVQQPQLDLALHEVENNMSRLIAVKAGWEEPHHCGLCDYCKSVKKAKIRDYSELIGG